MKNALIASFALLLFAGCGDSEAENTLELKTEKDKLSYAVGADHAQQLINDPGFGQYDKEQIIKGFEMGVETSGAFDESCQQTLQRMMGMGTGSVDPAYKSEGSLCIGKLLGMYFLDGWKQENFIGRFDMKLVKIGFTDALNQVDTLIPQGERDKMLTSLIGELNEKVFAQAVKKEAAFFTNVKLIPGVKDIGNGIYLETLVQGNGGSPQVGDDVKANYVLISPKGDTLESSLDAARMGQPAPAFSLNKVIQGWAIAFPMLKKGGKYRLYVPQGLAYAGNPPQGSPIERFSPLIFYIELLDFGRPGTLVQQQQMPQMH